MRPVIGAAPKYGDYGLILPYGLMLESAICLFVEMLSEKTVDSEIYEVFYSFI